MHHRVDHEVGQLQLRLVLHRLSLVLLFTLFRVALLELGLFGRKNDQKKPYFNPNPRDLQFRSVSGSTVHSRSWPRSGRHGN